MKSPFPGMDPYLESRWGDVHTSLITYIRDELQMQLPGNLAAQAEESVFVDTTPPDAPRWIKPDVSVVEELGGFGESGSAQTLTTEKPVLIQFPEETTRWVEIRDLDTGNQLVTVIEVLSPSNKCSEAGRNEYRRKQREYFEAAINLVEIDLLRSGERIFLACPPQGIRPQEKAPYYVSVARGASPWERELYPISLRQALPNIAIPLRETDEDVVLPLQKLIGRCYEMGRYARRIDYSQSPTPELEKDDAEWAVEITSNNQSNSSL